MANPAYDVPEEDAQSYDLNKVGAYWKDQLEKAASYFQAWKSRCEKIENIYLQQQTDKASTAKRNFPMLWANISVLQPATYARTPQPAVDRRFKDDDPISRTASEMIERNLSYLMEAADVDATIREARDDFLICGRGIAWLRYEADIEPIDMGIEPSESSEGEAQEPMEQITGERVCIDYVHWSDFMHSPARRWKDVTWVARRVSMEKEDIAARFGEEALSTLSGTVIGANAGNNETERAQNEGKTFVWEIWCKSENYTVWIADGSPVALEVSEPPLDLEGFWPCPRPAYGTLSTGSLIPVPDYAYYQGQCEEIDILTKRINKLSDQLRLKIFYPSGDGSVSPAIEKAMRPENDTVMVPIPEWAAFTDKGGSNAIITLPIDEVQKVITACIENRKQLIEDVYQITGISDIVRGDTEASETATAQRIKSQWGSIRIRDRQTELARFSRDIVRIAGEIICNQFQPETLMLMSGMELPTAMQKQQAQMQAQQAQAMYQQATARAQMMGQQPSPAPQPPPGFDKMMQTPTIDEVVALLRNDNIRGFRIDIETDSTIEPDETASQERILKFAEVVGGFIEQAGPVAQVQPMLIPVMGEVLLTVVRNFRAGRQLESTLEQAVSQLTASAMAPKPPPQPTPEQMIDLKTTQVKADAEETKAKLGIVQTQMEHRANMEKMRGDMVMNAMDHHQKMQQASAQPKARTVQ